MTEYGLRIADSPNTVTPTPDVPDDTIRLSVLLAMLRRGRRTMLLAAAIFLLLGLLYLLTTPRTYVASAVVLLNADSSPAVREVIEMDDRALSDSAIENALLVIRSEALASAVVARLELHRNPSFLNPPRSLAATLVDTLKGAVRAPLSLLRPGSAPSGSVPTAATDPEALERSRVARDLGARIEVQRIGRSSALSLSFASHDPVLAAAIVNTFADAYIADVLDANLDATNRTAEWLQGRLADLEAAAAEAAAEAEAFRAKHGLVSSDGRFMSEDAVSQLNADLADAIAETARSRALVAGYEAVVARGIDGLRSGASVSTSETVDPALEELQADLADAVADLNRITATFGSDHPQAQLLATEIDKASERLFVGAQQRLERARGELSVAKARVAALRESLGTAVGDNAAAGTAQVELRALEQRAETLSTLYQTSLSRLQEIEQQREFPISDVRILTTAEVPRAADSPRASRTLAMALILGLLVGLALSTVREWADRSLRTGDQVTSVTGVPFLGYLPTTHDRPQQRDWISRWVLSTRHRLPRGWPGAVGDQLSEAEQSELQAAHDQAIYGETLQTIRLALDAPATVDRRPVFSLRRIRDDLDTAPAGRGVLGITSLRPSEDRFAVALNLAGTLAAGGASVLLVDADMRRPGISSYLGLTDRPSLLDVALGQTAWPDVVCKAGPPNLDILPCARVSGAGHVADLLTAGPVRTMLAEARERYDHVLVDLAPLAPMVEGRVMMRSMSRVLLVATWGETPKSLLRTTLQRDPALGERLLGIVLDQVDLTALRTYADDANDDADLRAYAGYLT